MKASSFFIVSMAVATLTIAPANADRKVATTTLATTTGNCSTTTWPVVSAVQCTKPHAHSYTECTEAVRKGGNDSSGAWWWCSSQGFKN
jgi:hypothetical protein